MKKLIPVIILCCAVNMQAQEKFYTKSGTVSIFSKAPLEDIEAHNKALTCVLDSKTGNIQFAILMKGFEFEKALMQEHFNENYVESHKYPKAEFRGSIVNNAAIDYSKDGTYDVTVKGQLTIHGVTNETTAQGKVMVKSGKPETSSTFNILLSDYKIEIPRIVKENISNTVKIDVNCVLEPLKG